ncbi:hypothetical protein ONO57_26420, partial [Salmonella enterica subsp. enterica serovar Anatum]|nr:hypothetical protein [Salmonella enterica subsp. enterica serovar Anatum]
LEDMMAKVPETVPEDERIWFALAAYNMGYAHMLDARSLTVKTLGEHYGLRSAMMVVLALVILAALVAKAVAKPVSTPQPVMEHN